MNASDPASPATNHTPVPRRQIHPFLLHLLAVFLLAMDPCLARAQWVHTNVPFGGSVSSLALQGGRAFAGTVTGAGLFVADSGTTSWHRTNGGLPARAITALACAGTDIYAGLSGGDLFRSTNGGTSWTSTGFSRKVSAITGVDAHLVVASEGGGLRYSTDRGETWIVATYPPDFFNITPKSFAWGEGLLYCGFGGHGVGVSADSGVTWYVANSGVEAFDVPAVATLDSIVFAGTTDHGIYRRIGHGSSWIASNEGIANRSVNALAIAGSTVFAGTNDGLFLSHDRGEHWDLASADLPPGTFSALAATDGLVFAGTAFGGVFRSTDNGEHWSACNQGLSAVPVGEISSCGKALFLLTVYGYHSPKGLRLFRSIDQGTTWLPVGADTSEIYHCGTDGTRLFVHGSSGFMLSEDNGDSWIPVGTSSQLTRVSAVGVRGSHLMAGTWGTSSQGGVAVFVSTDRGLTWTNVSNPWPYMRIAGRVQGFSTTGPGTYVISGRDNPGGKCQSSTDHGLSWDIGTSLPELGTGYGTTYDEFLDGGSEIYASGSSQYERALFRSTDHGVSWTMCTPPIPPFGGGSIGLTGSTLFSVGGGIALRSIDAGETWTDMSTGLDSSPVTALGVEEDALYLASANGSILRYTLRGTSHLLVRDDEGLPVTDARVELAMKGVRIAQARTDSSSVATFADVVAGSAPEYRVFCDRTMAWGEQFWGVSTGRAILPFRAVADTFVRSTPFIAGVQVYIDSTNELIPDSSRRMLRAGTKLRIEMSIKNPAVAGARTVKASGRIVVDHDRQTPFDLTVDGNEQVFAPGDMRTPVFYFTVPADTTALSIICASFLTSDLYGLTLTDASDWFTPFRAVLTGVPENDAPSTFVLEQNFPNPFNPSTVIRFGVPSASQIALQVYNVLGQQVASLIDHGMDAGYHEVTFDARALPSGVYIYRMKVLPADHGSGSSARKGSGEFVATRRMVIMR